MSGFIGAYCCSPDACRIVLARLPEARRRTLVCFPSDNEAADFRKVSARGLMSGPYLAHGNADAAGAVTRDSIIVSFVGHLATPVAGVDVPTSRPADVVRIAYGKWGRESFALLNGNYAVAIYDSQLPGLLVARDAAGTKPVFYSGSENLVFGSSAIEVLRASGLPAVANPRALLRYLENGLPDGIDDTLLEGIYALPAAHYLECVSGRSPRIFPIECGINVHPAHLPASFAQCSQKLRHLLLDTVKAQSSGGKVGAALSGGIDTSGVIACLRAAIHADEPLHAFCFVHDHEALPSTWNERPWAEMAANHVCATLHPVRLEPSAIPVAMSRIFQAQDFPFGSPVILAQAEVFRVAADMGIQIMFNGHGPDALFGGAVAHIAARARQLLRGGHIFAAWRLVHGASDYAALSPQRLLMSSVRRGIAIRRRKNRFPVSPLARKSWFLDRVNTSDNERGVESADPVRWVTLDQLYRSSLPVALHVEECNAASHNLENRSPYLVAAVLNLAGELPSDFLVSDAGEAKCLLRSALRNLVPDATLNRRDRVAFAVPVLPWLQELQPWVEGRLKEFGRLPFFQETPVPSMWQSLRGADPSAWTSAFHLWRWITLLQWTEAHDVKFS